MWGGGGCRLNLLVYCLWMSLLLLLYCPSLFLIFFCTARRALVHTRGSRLISISLLLLLLSLNPTEGTINYASALRQGAAQHKNGKRISPTNKSVMDYSPGSAAVVIETGVSTVCLTTAIAAIVGVVPRIRVAGAGRHG